MRERVKEIISILARVRQAQSRLSQPSPRRWVNEKIKEKKKQLKDPKWDRNYRSELGVLIFVLITQNNTHTRELNEIQIFFLCCKS